MSQFDSNNISIVPIQTKGISGSTVFFPIGISTSSFNTTGSDYETVINASASVILELEKNGDHLQFRTPSSSLGTSDDKIQFFISKSAAPKIGIGTNNPLSTLDIVDVEDSADGFVFLIRNARTTTEGGQLGDAAGTINFIITSGSYNNVTTSGSVGKITSTVTAIDDEGAAGELKFEVADKNNPKLDTTQVLSLQKDSNDNADIVASITGSALVTKVLYASQSEFNDRVWARSLLITDSAPEYPGNDNAKIQGTLDVGDITTTSITASVISASGGITGSFTGSFVGDGSGLTGVGTVDTTGTPADSQIAVFTDATTIEGTSGLTYDGTTLDIDGANAGSGVRIYGGVISVTNPYISPMGFHSILNFGDSSTGYILSMQNNKISFDSDASNTYIQADTDTPENLEIHADGNIELRADDILEIHSSVSASGDITGSSFTGSFVGDGSGLTGVGTVDTFGTPLDNQVAVFRDADTIEGDANFTWSATNVLTIDGSTKTRVTAVANDGIGGIVNAAGEFGYGAEVWQGPGINDTPSSGSIYYLTSGGTMALASSGSSAAATGFLSYATDANSSDGMVLRGFVYIGNQGQSSGDKIYLADNGELTPTLPSTSTHFVRIVGYASANSGIIYFSPSNDYIQLA